MFAFTGGSLRERGKLPGARRWVRVGKCGLILGFDFGIWRFWRGLLIHQKLKATASRSQSKVQSHFVTRVEPGIDTLRGKVPLIIEAWNSYDQLGMLRPIGALETPRTDRFVRAEMA
jgi:hypothetical protein